MDAVEDQLVELTDKDDGDDVENAQVAPKENNTSSKYVIKEQQEKKKPVQETLTVVQNIRKSYKERYPGKNPLIFNFQLLLFQIIILLLQLYSTRY